MKSLQAVLLCAALAAGALADDPDIGRDMVAIVTARGYPIEQHYVTTADGFILGMFRIPPRAGNGTAPPVLLQHGLLDSSWTWVNNFATESLAFLLSNAGFDVWLSNSRGNTYSLRHTTLQPSDDAFWDWSWDEMAAYDLPANIQYVLNVTGASRLAGYVGHSQGTTQAFAGFSLNTHAAASLERALRARRAHWTAALGAAKMPPLDPSFTVASSSWYTARLNLFGALAPVAFLQNQKSLLVSLLADLDVVDLFEIFGVQDFFPSTSIINKLDPGLCNLVPWACEDLLFLLCGASNHLNESRIAVYVSETPAGTSVKNMAHWAQGVKTENFQMYDYGCNFLDCENEKHYGQKTPPAYPIVNITVPTAFYFGDDDDLGDLTDVQTLLNLYPPAAINSENRQTTYAHLDYTWGVDANTYVYADLIGRLQAALRAQPVFEPSKP